MGGNKGLGSQIRIQKSAANEATKKAKRSAGEWGMISSLSCEKDDREKEGSALK